MAVAGLCLPMLAGCIVLSVYPFYNPQDVIFDPAITGHWAKADAAGETWQFDAAGDNAYLVTVKDSNQTNCFEAHLFKLKQSNTHFLDLLTTNRDAFELPMHLISTVTQNDSNLTVQFMDYGWLTRVLETNTVALRHIVVPQNTGDTNQGNMLYVTASTRDLQGFLLKYAIDTNAFNPASAINLNRTTQ